MTNYEVRAFEAHHYLMIKDDLESAYGIRLDYLDSARIAHNFANNGNVGRSGFYCNRLLICAGIMMPWRGLGTAWAMLSSEAKNHPYFVHKAVMEGLEYFILRFKLKRVEANVSDELDPAKRWVERIGFIEESKMPCYGPRGETFIRYVMLP